VADDIYTLINYFGKKEGGSSYLMLFFVVSMPMTVTVRISVSMSMIVVLQYEWLVDGIVDLRPVTSKACEPVTKQAAEGDEDGRVLLPVLLSVVAPPPAGRGPHPLGVLELTNTCVYIYKISMSRYP
jgi:hypothetical protein